MDHEGYEEQASVSTEQPRCSSAWCSSNPLQPVYAAAISNTKGTLGIGEKSKTSCFQVAWYKKHPLSWLHLCASNFKAVCSLCMATSGTKGDTAFTQEGSNNWKKATKTFVEHEQSLPHKTAVDASNSKTSQQSISGKLIFYYQKYNNNDGQFHERAESYSIFSSTGLDTSWPHERRKQSSATSQGLFGWTSVVLTTGVTCLMTWWMRSSK